jgi:hypothetical protein
VSLPRGIIPKIFAEASERMDFHFPTHSEPRVPKEVASADKRGETQSLLFLLTSHCRDRWIGELGAGSSQPGNFQRPISDPLPPRSPAQGAGASPDSATRDKGTRVAILFCWDSGKREKKTITFKEGKLPHGASSGRYSLSLQDSFIPTI